MVYGCAEKQGPWNYQGNFLNISFGYGFGLMIGILASGGVSGGHLNPAVTLTMAVFKKCKWIQVCLINQSIKTRFVQVA